MTTAFPAALDTFVNPNAAGGDTLASVPHDSQHANINDSVTAIETKLGINSSAVVTSIDYLLKSTSSADPGHLHSVASIEAAGVAGPTTFLRGDGTWAVPSTGGVTSFTGDGTILSNSSSTGAVTASLENAPANTVLGNNTGSSAAPSYQSSISIGTISSAAHTIKSSSANALVVGPNGSTNPAFSIDASTASSATGINIKSAAAGGGIALSVISSGSNEAITITPKGQGNSLGQGVVFGNTSNPVLTAVKYAGNGSNPSAYVVCVNGNYINSVGGYFGSPGWKYDSTGPGIAQVQCGVGTNNTFTPQVIINFSPINGTANSSATLTASANFSAVGLCIGNGTTVASTPLDVTGTSTFRGNAVFANVGNGIQIKGGSNARIGTGTLSGGTVTISNTSVTANTLVFLTDTGGSSVNLGALTVSVSAGSGFTVTSSNALDASTFNYLLVEQN